MQLIYKHKIITKLNENNYSDATTSIYQSWILRFIDYHHLTPEQYKISHIFEYLSSLAPLNFRPSTYNQALNAVVFFYNKVLKITISKAYVSDLRLSHSKNPPEILSKKQIDSIIYHLKGAYQLLAHLLFGCGLRSSEVLALKIKDINLVKNQLTVSNPQYFRTLSIPSKITDKINSQIDFVKTLYINDSKSKFFQKIPIENIYLFPMKQLCNNDDGKLIRLPIIGNTLNYNITTATKKTSIAFKVTAQTFRYSYAVRLLQNQINIKTLQKLLGHQHASSTLVYAQIAQQISKHKPLSTLDLE